MINTLIGLELARISLSLALITAQVQSLPPTTTPTLTTPLDAWIEGLVDKESSGKTRIKILDVNNRYSYGCLQFQEPTLKQYAVKYGLVSSTQSVAPFFYDCDFQKRLAKLMIQDDHNNWRHWYHSVITRKLGLPPKESSEEMPQVRGEG